MSYLQIFKYSHMSHDDLDNDQVPWRRAREPVEHDVVDRNHFPLRRLRWHCPKHLLWTRHCRHHWNDGDYFVILILIVFMIIVYDQKVIF